MTSTDAEYYAIRAEEERRRADQANSGMVAEILRSLAKQFMQLAVDPNERLLVWALEDVTR